MFKEVAVGLGSLGAIGAVGGGGAYAGGLFEVIPEVDSVTYTFRSSDQTLEQTLKCERHQNSYIGLGPYIVGEKTANIACLNFIKPFRDTTLEFKQAPDNTKIYSPEGLQCKVSGDLTLKEVECKFQDKPVKLESKKADDYTQFIELTW
ncbi:hypothetical protein MHLP_01485 [Candidatus Mycoplasma haematolamae str. Purdue]|uniref:Uncharacterized protein n=1 Tax=Mycoplasma haematolamae (strain Purdue) TaxID=1212765 RepID=I7C5T5_MYCHA|nr:hypothetical protein [Candidatus Mycoplasma haematolamae]AFO51877.1 hypothetical protein MHLP_01485 [Candidatus Mycoplasma haematolamae str. Purdue]